MVNISNTIEKASKEASVIENHDSKNQSGHDEQQALEQLVRLIA